MHVLLTSIEDGLFVQEAWFNPDRDYSVLG